MPAAKKNRVPKASTSKVQMGNNQQNGTAIQGSANAIDHAGLSNTVHDGFATVQDEHVPLLQPSPAASRSPSRRASKPTSPRKRGLPRENSPGVEVVTRSGPAAKRQKQLSPEELAETANESSNDKADDITQWTEQVSRSTSRTSHEKPVHSAQAQEQAVNDAAHDTANLDTVEEGLPGVLPEQEAVVLAQETREDIAATSHPHKRFLRDVPSFPPRVMDKFASLGIETVIDLNKRGVMKEDYKDLLHFIMHLAPEEPEAAAAKAACAFDEIEAWVAERRLRLL